MSKVVFIAAGRSRASGAAATVPKLKALAGLVDEVVVLADGAVDDVLPPNCRIRSFRSRVGGCAGFASRRRSPGS